MDTRTPARHARRRRPSGEPPPLPRPAYWRASVLVLVATIALGLLLGFAASDSAPDAELFRRLASSDALDALGRPLEWLTTPTAILLLRVGLVLALVIFGRLRHLLVAIATMWFVDLAVDLVHVSLPDPGIAGESVPTGGFSFPDQGVTQLAVTAAIIGLALVPAGRGRRWALAGGAAVCVLVGIGGVLEGASYPFTSLYGIVLAYAIALTTFGALAPDEAFPVSYARGGNAAHLDLSGARGEAVIQAMDHQLGLTVTEVRPFGEEGSGGSTPLLMTLEDGTRLFGKILATSHVRSDRWYRIVRTIMYGRLEDETAFTSVRRLAAYEDYALRLLDDEGIRVAHSYGLVELTPNREYLLVTEFFEGAETLGHAEVDGEIVDQGVELIRALWDAGLAHRDIKPANLLVVDGRLQLIDVSVLQVRPTPWRQAVDLANMLLVLGLRHDPEDVYRRAQVRFSPEELAEAFASAQGLAIPTELQTHLKEKAPDLLDRYKAMAPPFPTVSIQRWSLRRVGLTAGVVLGGLAAIGWSLAIVLTV